MERRKSASHVASGEKFLDPEWSKKYPLIWEHLSETAFSDGAPRQGSTLTLFCEPGLVKLCLSDREEGATGWATGVSVLDALKSLEGDLKDGAVDWRPSRGQKKRS